MSAFFSPIDDPASWTLTTPSITTLPPGLRYGGYSLLGLRAERATAATVQMPALGILRQAAGVGAETGKAFVEIQVNPFPIRRIAAAFPFGLPTFYLVFDAGTTPVAFSADDTETGMQPLATATAVTVLMMGQDRIVRHPALWARQVNQAILDGGGHTDDWAPFSTAVSAATAPAAEPPVVLLDHAGRPHTDGSVQLTAGGATVQATLAAADNGDLQRTVARMHAADPVAMPRSSVFEGAPSVTIAPTGIASSDFQLVRLDDATTGTGHIDVSSAGGHVAFTDLDRWFANQFATPVGASSPPLARYTRGNELTTFVNGPEFFKDLFHELQQARSPSGGFHLAGWAMLPDTVFTQPDPGDPGDFPTTLEHAFQRIHDAGGQARFLPAKFFSLEPAQSVSATEILAFDLISMGILIMSQAGADFVHTDAAGTIVLFALMVANAWVITSLLESGGAPLEPNKHAVDLLGAVDASSIHLAPFPARVDDNPAAPPTSEFPFDVVFTVDRHFGIYHQKLSVVKTPGGFVAYCGGIDLNSDRLDDARHLNPHPFHDVHARFGGPAVRDLALTFEQRWARDGGGTPPAFSAPTEASLGAPGRNVVQIARTYFRAADPSRRLEFAPSGDRTLNDTLLRAIGEAQEFIYVEDQYFTPPSGYSTALVAKVASGDVKRLIVALPGITDQPFGELVRSELITRLVTADAGRGIVRIGYPRRHFTLPDNDLRAASGRLVLMEALGPGGGISPSVVLGPLPRLPRPPFWVAVEGELMYVYDELPDVIAAGSTGTGIGSGGGGATGTGASPVTTGGARRFAVVRGGDTRLVKGAPAPAGAKPRAHAVGAAATVVDLTSIYVHAKMMIVDDVFLSIGSANLNRRGLFHDGEVNSFTVPEALKGTRDNPVAALRRRLWAEMLDLPAEMAGPLLSDPVAASALFDRSPFLGNRYVDIGAYPAHVMFGATTGDGVVASVLQLLGFTIAAFDHVKLFNGVVDPTSSLEGP